MTPNFEAAATAIQSATEQGRAAFESMLKTGQAQMTEAQAKVAAEMSEMAVEGRANVDAVMKASDVVMKAIDSANKDALAFARTQFEKNVEAGKALLSVKSVDELVALQTGLVKNNVEAAYAQTVKLSRQAAMILNQAFAPLGDRMNAVAGRFSRPFAA